MIVIEHNKKIVKNIENYSINLIGTYDDYKYKYVSYVVGNIEEFKDDNQNIDYNIIVQNLPRDIKYIDKFVLDYQSKYGYVSIEKLKVLLQRSVIDREVGDIYTLNAINNNRIETLESLLFALISSLKSEGILSPEFINKNKELIKAYECSKKHDKFKSLLESTLKLKNILNSFNND